MPHSLALSCALIPSVAAEVSSAIASIGSFQEQRVRERFRASLTQSDRALFDRQSEISYDRRDWWRSCHDVYVTCAMARIVEGENKERVAAGRRDLLPEWLTTAALVHDRGYAILGRCRELEGAEYLTRDGAHWEAGDTRIAHAQLSRRYAGALLFGIADTGLEKLVDSSRLEGAYEIKDPELFLRVIETHDYPFVGRYDEMPLEARHHFDADSLFSISVLSFVKDYLAYLRDAAKVNAALELGLGDKGVFMPRGLLIARMSRYFEATRQLPAGWDLVRFPLLERARLFSEGRCIPPHSTAARKLTEASFKELASCCVAMEEASSIEVFLEWMSCAVARQFDEVLRQDRG